jgi:hypothetical protein
MRSRMADFALWATAPHATQIPLGLRNPARQFLHLRAGVHSSDFPRERFHFFRKNGIGNNREAQAVSKGALRRAGFARGGSRARAQAGIARFELMLHVLVTRQCSAWVMCFRLSGADNRPLAAPPDARPVSAFHDGDQFRAKCRASAVAIILPPRGGAAVQTTPADAAGVLPPLLGASRPHLLCVSVDR